MVTCCVRFSSFIAIFRSMFYASPRFLFFFFVFDSLNLIKFHFCVVTLNVIFMSSTIYIDLKVFELIFSEHISYLFYTWSFNIEVEQISFVNQFSSLTWIFRIEWTILTLCSGQTTWNLDREKMLENCLHKEFEFCNMEKKRWLDTQSVFRHRDVSPSHEMSTTKWRWWLVTELKNYTKSTQQTKMLRFVCEWVSELCLPGKARVFHLHSPKSQSERA